MRKITTSEMMHIYGGFGAGVDYAVRISVRLTDPVDADILRRALDRTQPRYPYLCGHLVREGEELCFADDPRPIALIRGSGRISLGGGQSNGHLLAVCYDADYIHLDIYHGLTDGDGMYRFLATMLYYYCAERYGVEVQPGIGLCTDTIDEQELADPQDALPMPDEDPLPASPMPPAFTLETDGGLSIGDPVIWDVELQEEAFVRFTSANDASPGTMIALLLSKAIDALYPGRDKEIINAYVVNARPMLHAQKTYHITLSMAFLNYSDKIKAMPLMNQCTIFRGKTFAQCYDPSVVRSLAANAGAVKAAAQAAKTYEDKKKVFGAMFNGGEEVVTSLISYVGKWKYEALGQYITEFWSHPSNTFGMMIEIAAVGGRIFLSIQQRYKEDDVIKAFLAQLEEHAIPYKVCRVMKNDVASVPEPEADPQSPRL